MSDRSSTPAHADGIATLDLVEQARSLRALVSEHAEAAEARGALTDEVVDAFHTRGLFGMWVPRSLGGAELPPTRSLRVLEELAQADPSASWVLMTTSIAIGMGAAYLGDDALFGGERFPVIAGQGTKLGRATPDGDGFRLSGAWSFASGIKHASHIHTAGLIEGTNEARIFVLPVEQATLIDNWDVLGLRGTGSIDYTIDNVFIPAAYTHDILTETPKRGGGLFLLGIINFATLGHAGWALGVGRRMLDELCALAQEKSGRPGQLVDSDSFHAGYGDAEAKYRAARAFVFEIWSEIEETLGRGEPLSVRQKTLIRLALHHVTWTVHEVAHFVYAAAGTIALRRGTIQRFFRDMHAGSQHITSSPPVLQVCGRELAGLAQGKEWRMLNLV